MFITCLTFFVLRNIQDRQIFSTPNDIFLRALEKSFQISDMI